MFKERERERERDRTVNESVSERERKAIVMPSPTKRKKRRRRYIEYDRQESLVILTLTLWRNACLHNHLEKVEFSPMNLISYILRDGWKENKVAARQDPMIKIVNTNVLPFLDM